MKKIAIGLLLLLSNLSMAQENTDVKKETKFQVGVHYVGNLRNENIISDGFNGVVGIPVITFCRFVDKNASLFLSIFVGYLPSNKLRLFSLFVS